MKIWSMVTFTELKTLSENSSSIECMIFTPNSKTLISGGGDNLIRLWSMETFTEIKTLQGH